MEHYPLLFFPSSIEDVKVGKRRNIQRHISTPNPQRQSERITPSLRALCNVIEDMNVHIQEDPNGIDPETVLVLKTVGTVDDFANAVKRIDGMEWLGEFDVDDISPDDDFYDTEKPESILSGRLYMVSTNKEAINELLTLWQRYTSDPETPFDRGYAKFKSVFSLLKEIRRWDTSDRFEGTKAKEIWLEQIEMRGQQEVSFEIELWYRQNPTQLSSSFAEIASKVSDLGGRINTQCVIDEIQYAAASVTLPADKVLELINNDNVALAECEGIMFFRPAGQMEFSIDANETLQAAQNSGSQTKVSGDPIIGIFDGYPMTNHSILANRLIVDDPDGYASSYAAKEMVHGTAMCSLIIRGDIQENGQYIASPLYVRPIMKPNPHAINREEHIPSDTLIVDVIHRAVKEMYEGQNQRRPSAPSVKVINLSIGDPARMFFNTVSPLAKLLDWLSYKYSILFIISAGNHSSVFDFQINESEYNAKTRGEQEKLFVNSIVDTRIQRHLLSPAESINSITVGAAHCESGIIKTMDPRINPYDSLMPATYSSFGGGPKNSVKPDLVFDGGRQTFIKDVLHFSPLSPMQFPKSTPGHLVAYPDNSLNGSVYSIGTSNAAALTTRNAYFCLKTIHELSQQYVIDDKYVALLAKAMLVHGCSWDGIGENIDKYLDSSASTVSKKKLKAKWIGYGYPDYQKSICCNPQLATVIGLGSIKKEKAELFHFPVPECLNAKTEKRKLTVTLAWLSPINAANQKYRKARLWFEISGKQITQSKDDIADENIAKRGTIQHEVFVGSSALPIGDSDNIVIKVTCDKDASNITEEIPFAIMVSLEVAPGINLPIYEEVCSKIASRVPVGIENQ